MKRRDLLRFGGAALATALLTPKKAQAATAATAELIIRYNLKDGYDPTAQKIDLIYGDQVKSYHLTSSRTTVFATEGDISKRIINSVGGSPFIQVNRKSNVLNRATMLNGKMGFDLFTPTSLGYAPNSGAYVAIHGPVHDGNDMVGSLLCYRVRDENEWQRLLDNVTRLQNSGVVVTWRIQHDL